MTGRDRQDQQDRVFEALDVATAPIRGLRSLIQAAFILVALVLIGLFFPLVMFLAHHPITPTAWLVSGMTLLVIVTFFHAPGYTVIGGTLFGIVFIWVLVPINGNWACANFKYLLLGFLLFGNLQKFVITQLNKPPASRPFKIKETANSRSDGAKKKPEKRGTPKAKSARKRKPSPQKTTVEYEGRGCKECEVAYQVLGVENGADAASCKDAYRDLAKVWHPDRFGDGDFRLKKKAEEQFRAVKAAYEHLRTPHIPATTVAAECPVEAVPLSEALQEALDYFENASREMGELVEDAKKGAFKSREERARTIRRIHSLRNCICERIEGVIARIKTEMPEYSTADFEQMLEIISRQEIPRV